MIDRLCFAAVLVAAAAASVLAFAEPAKVAAARGTATPVVELERVVVTVPRTGDRAVAARVDAEPATRAVQ